MLVDNDRVCSHAAVQGLGSEPQIVTCQCYSLLTLHQTVTYSAGFSPQKGVIVPQIRSLSHLGILRKIPGYHIWPSDFAASFNSSVIVTTRYPLRRISGSTFRNIGGVQLLLSWQMMIPPCRNILNTCPALARQKGICGSCG